jgi:hypothetical protein
LALHSFFLRTFGFLARSSSRLNVDLEFPSLIELLNVARWPTSRSSRPASRALRFSTLDAIGEALSCQPGDILRFEPEQAERERLLPSYFPGSSVVDVTL